jgi:HD superfamily phosphohydrolase
MQYYKHPKNIELDKYKEAFEKLITVSDVIAEIRILGGEPLMNKEMYKVIEWFHDCDKIKYISVYTNGTIIPSDEMLDWFTREKVRVRISDYIVNRDKIEKLIKKLEERKINYFINQYDDWQDAGNLDYRDNSPEEMQKKFMQCFERNCVTFFRGELHKCPRSAHAMNLKAMPRVEDDYIDLENWNGSDQELKQALKKFQKKTYVEACNYCDGTNYLQHIPAAVQTASVLPYKMIGEGDKTL